MRAQNDTFVIGGTRIALGLSLTPLLITPPVGSADGFLKWISGGSLEIVSNNIPGASIAGQTVAAIGYIVGTTEVVNLNGPASFYVMAAGATSVFGLRWHFSSGATLG